MRRNVPDGPAHGGQGNSGPSSTLQAAKDARCVSTRESHTCVLVPLQKTWRRRMHFAPTRDQALIPASQLKVLSKYKLSSRILNVRCCSQRIGSPAANRSEAALENLPTRLVGHDASGRLNHHPRPDCRSQRFCQARKGIPTAGHAANKSLLSPLSRQLISRK